MSEFEKKQKEYMNDNNIRAEHLVFDQSCHTVKEAAQAANANVDDLVKNICLIDSHNNLIVAIVKGEDRVSIRRVSKALKTESVRIAEPAEILSKAGYPVGGTPSFGYKAVFLIDPRVMEKEEVYTSGGSARSLVRISPKELQRANDGLVIRIRG